TWILLRRTIPQLSLIPHRWDRKLFREMCGYGAHFQFVTFSQALREPVTKTLLAKFGGLAMTGFYDMASRWVFTFRELIVQANLVLVPTISSLKESDAAAIPRIYRESYRLIFFLAVPTFSALVIFSPTVSRLWLGRYEPVFVQFVALLALGWLVNILSNPAYVVDLGTGALRWVSIGCAVTVILNPAVGFLVGRAFGGIAVVMVSVLSLATGYAIVLIAYHRENHVSFRELLPGDSFGILFASALGVMIFLPYFCSEHSGTYGLGRIIGFMAMALVMVLPMWRHPMRKRLVGWIASQMPA
ncbi:MAG TPA: oligosaccharide flippase family protein, partial [Candidatus Acidoferrales bacterium]